MRAWKHMAAGAILVACGGGVSGADAQPVTPRLAYDRPVIETGTTATVHVRIEFSVIERETGAAPVRGPLNLALVLDRSGSMEEARKIDYLRDAAAIALDRLSAKDRIAMVEYDDRITVLWPSQPARELAPLKRLIQGLFPRGSTDLAGGLVAGIEQARPHVRDDAITRVILMTDGLANHGVTEPAAIRKIARDAKAKGVRTTTIGLGLDFNETLLQGIAETGGGTYYYVESPRQMARIFDQEMQGLSSTVARDCVIRLHLDGPARGVTPLGVPSRSEGGDTVIDLEDFYAGERRALLVRLEVAAGAPGPVPLGRVTLAYRDPADGQQREIEAELAVEAADAARAAASVDAAVAAQAALAVANEVQGRAVERLEAGEAETARRMLQDLAADLDRQNAVLKDRTLAAKVEALALDQERLAAAPAGAAPAAQAMAKATRSQAYQVARGKTVALLLQKGDRGPEVARLAEALTAAGVLKVAGSDEFDQAMVAAVRAYQQREGLTVDGVAGPATLNRLGLY